MDRPVFGFLVQRLVAFIGVRSVVFVALNTMILLVFAVESAIFFAALFPEYQNYASLAACLTLAPIVVQTQLCTVMVFLPANVPVVLGYGATLLLLRNARHESRSRPLFLGAAFTLALCGIALSEYGVAANLVGVAVLFELAIASVTGYARRRLLGSGSVFLALSLSGYALFTKIADLNTRPDVIPAVQVRETLARWVGVPFDIASGALRATITDYARVLGAIVVEWNSKSTILGVLFAFLTAGLLCYGTRNRKPKQEVADESSLFTGRFAVLLLAVLIGLLPVRLMGRLTILGDFASRFLLPILPIAAALTAAMSLTLIANRRRWLAVATLGFVIGHVTWMSAYAAAQQHREIAAVGNLLRQHVEKMPGFTVAVMPYDLLVNPGNKDRFNTTFDALNTELTATMSSSWPVELEERLWVMGPQNAETHFGQRSACDPAPELDAHNRNLQRTGKLDGVLWVNYQPGEPSSVEPYCQRTALILLGAERHPQLESALNWAQATTIAVRPAQVGDE